jgi:hypothetical protein
MAVDENEPDLQEPQKFAIDNPVEHLFGLFFEGAVYRVIGAGHIVLAPKQYIVASAAPAAGVGESPYDIYYRLQ